MAQASQWIAQTNQWMSQMTWQTSRMTWQVAQRNPGMARIIRAVKRILDGRAEIFPLLGGNAR